MPHVWNSTLKRSKPLRSTKPMSRGKGFARSRKPMKRIGKKSREWMTVRRRLKIQFEQMAITSCELRYQGCRTDAMLGFAHGRKRRHLRGDELETLTILACNVCHDQIEYLKPEEMLRIVQDTIAKRKKAA